MYIHAVDQNNMKALTVAMLSLKALENGCEDIDFSHAFEVICDYLKSNDRIFDKNM